MTQVPGEIKADAIDRLARSMGQDLGGRVIEQLAGFSRLFLTWNSRINLAGVRTPEELLGRHFADAFAATRFIGPGSRVVDVGTGGGLPILPVALVQATARFELHEPIAKKVAFLRTAVRELAMGDRVRIHAGRLEQPVPDEFREAFDVATSRATMSPAAWLSLGRELARPGGVILVFGTVGLPEGCPEPCDSYQYGVDRTLFIFPAARPP